MGKTGSMRKTQQRGIAIAPILFIVAILAVLASAIAAGSGSFSGDTSAVKAKAQASAILEQANLLTVAVQRVIGHGCTDTQISFENPMVSGYTNPNAPSDKSCHVFDVNGGGISFLPIKASELEVGNDGFFEFQGANVVTGLGCNDVSAACDELAGFLPIDSLKTCQEINKMVGMDGYLGEDVYVPSEKFRGAYFSSPNTMVNQGGTWKAGQMAGCLKKSSAYPSHLPLYAPYYFYKVLIVR
jgi:hypothetical protein